MSLATDTIYRTILKFVLMKKCCQYIYIYIYVAERKNFKLLFSAGII